MRGSAGICIGLVGLAVLALCIPTFSQLQARPHQFVIGRHSFIDIGPPFDFYEVFIVLPDGHGSSAVERLTVTPHGNECFVPAKVETASASINQSTSALLGSMNPCKIPEKALRHEQKRRKEGLVFSGADVVMEVSCGNQVRLLRSDILDRDMFDATTKTPQYTSWTMGLMQRLDDAVGPGVFETQRIFPMPEAEEQPTGVKTESDAIRDLENGAFDVLFQGAPDKPSDLYRQAQIPLPVPTVRLQNSVPFRPEVFVQPVYPPLARMARIEGNVSFKFDVDANGSATNLSFTAGHPLLRGTIVDAVKGWRFPKGATGQEIEATVEFTTNCPQPKASR